MIKKQKKGFGFGDFFAVLLILLILFFFFVVTDFSNIGKNEIRAAGKASLGTISITNYARTPIKISNQDLTLSDLIIADYELQNSATSKLSKAFLIIPSSDATTQISMIETTIKDETNNLFKTLGYENICWRLHISGTLFPIQSSINDCTQLSKIFPDFIDEKIYLPNPVNNNQPIEIWFEDTSLW